MSKKKMNIKEIKKEIEKYDNIREKVLQLNKILNGDKITYGFDYIDLKLKNNSYLFNYNYERYDIGCLFCGISINSRYDFTLTIKTKTCNEIDYWCCFKCKDKTLCAYCLREKENCNSLTKQKITFWLCTKTIFPKDIQRLIIKLFLKN